MKPSAAMLKGFAMAGGRQCVGQHYEGDDPRKPDAVCAYGAILLGVTGSAMSRAKSGHTTAKSACEIFRQSTGSHLIDANDSACQGQIEPMSIDSQRIAFLREHRQKLVKARDW